MIRTFEQLPPEEQRNARRMAEMILAAHRRYMDEFDSCTQEAQEIFEMRDWKRGGVNAERRAMLYRSAVQSVWRQLANTFPTHPLARPVWMGARQVLLERLSDDSDADLALTFFYSTMRISFGDSDVPVEYADAGLASGGEPSWQTYSAAKENLAGSIERMLQQCGFRVRFEDLSRDAALAADRLEMEWRKRHGVKPRLLRMLKPIFFRDQEAYLVGKLCARRVQLPVVLALKNGEAGITIEAVLAGEEDMRNILFTSTRSTFQVRVSSYRDVVQFLDSLAPARGQPAMCAVIGFTHPARVALNVQVRRHLEGTGEQFRQTPGRIGTAMIVFSPPGFPYVFKVIRDASAKIGWTGKQRIMDLYRWVHETNRGRLMLDAWMYRNLHFPARVFHESVLEELRRNAASSIREMDDEIVLKDVYAQRRVYPLNTFFDETHDAALREKAVDALGNFIKDLARMGFFVGEHYGLTFNTGLTHALNVTLFDFDDLGPLLKFRFRELPEMSEQDELMWNGELDGPWFRADENDVLVNEWETYLGVPADLREYFRKKHGDLFTLEFWARTQASVRAGDLHYVQPYPAEKRLPRVSACLS